MAIYHHNRVMIVFQPAVGWCSVVGFQTFFFESVSMNFFKLEDRGILCMTFRETEMLLALLRSPDIPVHRSATGTYLRSLLSGIVDPIRKSYSEGLDTVDKVLIQLMKSPEGLTFTMLKHLSGLSYGGSPNDLGKAITELVDSGVVVAEPSGPDGEEVYRLKEGFTPDAKLSEVSEIREATEPTPKLSREERTRNQILEMLQKTGGERSKTYIAKGLRLPFMDVDIALSDLLRDGKILQRKRKKFVFYRLAGTPLPSKTEPADAPSTAEAPATVDAPIPAPVDASVQPPSTAKPRPLVRKVFRPEGHTEETSPVYLGLKVEKLMIHMGYTLDRMQQEVNGAQKVYDYMMTLPNRAGYRTEIEEATGLYFSHSKWVEILTELKLIASTREDVVYLPDGSRRWDRWQFMCNETPLEFQSPPVTHKPEPVGTVSPEPTVSEPEPASSWAHLGEGYELL